MAGNFADLNPTSRAGGAQCLELSNCQSKPSKSRVRSRKPFPPPSRSSGVAPRRYGELINLHARQFAWLSLCFLGIGVGTESAQLLAEKAIELVEIVKGQETLRIAAEESRKIPKARMH